MFLLLIICVVVVVVMQTHTHNHIHTHTHKHTHTHTKHTHTNTQTHTHIYIHTHTHTRTHTCCVDVNSWITASFIDGTRNLKWCPNPNCHNAVKYDIGGPREIQCGCGHKFWYPLSLFYYFYSVCCCWCVCVCVCDVCVRVCIIYVYVCVCVCVCVCVVMFDAMCMFGRDAYVYAVYLMKWVFIGFFIARSMNVKIKSAYHISFWELMKDIFVFIGISPLIQWYLELFESSSYTSSLWSCRWMDIQRKRRWWYVQSSAFVCVCVCVWYLYWIVSSLQSIVDLAWCVSMYDVWCMMYDVWCMMYDVWCMMYECMMYECMMFDSYMFTPLMINAIGCIGKYWPTLRTKHGFFFNGNVNPTTQSNTGDKATRLWLKARTKSCPKCKVRIEKNRACNHMKCRNCGHDFCWLCKG